MDRTEFDPQEDQLIEDPDSMVEIEMSEEVYVFPTSFAQKRFWFLDQFDPGSPFYNIPIAVRLKGDFDEDIFQRCLNEISLRHETLRTTFSVMDGEPVQLISPHQELPVLFIDLEKLPDEQRESQAMRLAGEEARKPLDLSRGPLLRATLIRLREREHIVILIMHHIVSDGWSMGVLIAEISTLYSAFARGLPSPLPELPIQYADFAEWQIDWLKGDVLEEQINYWKDQFAGEISVLELPTDFPRPAVLTSRGSEASIRISKNLTDRLRELSQKESATLFMTLLAAFQILLYRYTNNTDISVGSPIANRNRAEIEGLIGVFINTLVFRTDLSGNPTFVELLERVRETTLGAYAHQDLPFEMLVDELQTERDMSHTPLFQVMFILQNAPAGGQPLPDLSIEQINIHMGTSTFDLSISISESMNGLDASIEYNSDIFSEATIQRMLGHYTQLLVSIVDDPQIFISDLPLLSIDEQKQVLIEWNNTQTDFPQDLCIHQFVEICAHQHPDREALVLPATLDHPRQALTYNELNQRSNQLAHYLIQRGAVPGMIVGISIERSIEMVISILGILKAGCAYLPLDPQYPSERLEFMIEDSRLLILVTQKNVLIELPDYVQEQERLRDLEIISIDGEWNRIEKLSTENPVSSVTSDNLAYVIYTSGSTGIPKGVMVPHKAVVNHNIATADLFALSSDDRVLQFATINFDTAVEELFPSFSVGATVVLRPNAQIAPGMDLHRLIEDERLTVLDPPTAYWHEWVRELSRYDSPLPKSLRVLIVGGEKASVEHLITWMEKGGTDSTWLNTYGPTEATVIATYYQAPSDIEWRSLQNIPIGRPIANVRCYILDEYLYPNPIGVPGELCIGGVGLADGYLNDPQLTAEKFVPDAYSETEGARIYKTGDVVRYLPDGNIEFLGRIDEQVKIRGFRVEPGEVEAIVVTHPEVDEVLVITDEASPGDLRLAAYVVPESKMKPTTGDLRRYALEHLPEYMVPSIFILVDTLPLTPNGKVDRRALPKPDWSHRDVISEFIAPRNHLEQELTAIWMDVLDIDQVGVYDNFFELGGHSLLATQLVSRIREVFNMELPLRKIFESPDIASISKQIKFSVSSVNGLDAPQIKPVKRDNSTGVPLTPQPLSFAQQRLWFLDQLDPGVAYNLPEAVRLTGKLDERVLERCLNEVVRRHEALRTTFSVSDGMPVQIITPANEITEDNNLYIKLKIVDLRHLQGKEREEEALKLAREEAQKPFELANGPLLRGSLVRLSGGDKDREVESTPENLILLTMHHVIGDNWSSNILIQEIALLYEAFLHGEDSPLQPLSLQYADFSNWQHQWLWGERLEEEIKHWKDQLSGLPSLLELPTDRPRPAVQTYAGKYQTFYLSEELSIGIATLCKQEGVTSFMLLLAAFQTLLYRYSGQEDISVGTPIANRNRVEIENIIGFFVNTLVLHSDFSNDPTFRELLKQVQEVAFDAYAHQDLPFEMIVDAVQPERDMSHSPLFQVMFALQSSQRTSQKLPESGLSLTPVEVHSGTAKFDLTLFMIEEEGTLSDTQPGYQISGAIEYNTDLFDDSTIERLIKHYEILLTSIVMDPDKPVTRLPIMDGNEIKQIIIDWNDTDKALLPDMFIQQLFEAQVEINPNNIAVKIKQSIDGQLDQFQEESLTYEELNNRANTLAHYLTRRGIGPDKLVGVLMERSIDLVVAIVGILKAGGAYLPLDPEYPPERLKFMIDDSKLEILITQVEQSLSVAIDEPIHMENPFHVIHIDQDWDEIILESNLYPDTELNPICNVTPDNLVYVIYTSGSTGRPKGTMITQRGLFNYLTWVQSAYPIEDGQGAPVHSSISFDLTITGLFGPLIVGKTIYLLPEGLGVDNLGEALRAEYVNSSEPFGLIKITPAHLHLLGEQLAPEEAIDRTHAFIIGGENLLEEHIDFWQTNSPATVLVNEYGPTETVVGCCVYFVPPDINGSTSQDAVIPIGRPIINTQLYILDQYLQPVPVGVVGELYIGGMGVSRGYLYRPEVTAENNIPNPFAEYFQGVAENDFSGGRLYKTGDLARYLPDGNIECLGRVDFQVKIRGFRVELGEIEALLGNHPDVSEAAAWVLGSGANKRLVAYVVPQASDTLNKETQKSYIQELRDYLQERVPDYMLPSAIVLLDALPLTPNGKLDRNALPVPDMDRSGIESEYVAPRSPQEEILVSIWANVLGVDLENGQEKIGIHDNFFNVGGHSLLATQVISRVQDAFQVNIPLRTIFETPTIAGLAENIDQTRLVEFGIATKPIRPLSRDEHTHVPIEYPPLSFAQQRLWFIEQLEPNSSLYNTPAVIRLLGSLNVAILERSINSVIQRHESLRTTFVMENERPVQVIDPESEQTINVHDISSISDVNKEAQALDIASRIVMTPFDLVSGPLVRFDLICMAEQEYIAVLNMHHIITDDWSLGVFIQEVGLFYDYYQSTDDEETIVTDLLAPMSIQYADFSSWQREWLQGEVLDQQLTYWREQLNGVPPLLELPTDQPRSAYQTYAGGQVTFDLTDKLSEGLYALGRELGATLFMVLLAAFQTLLYRYTGSSDISVGTPIANRTRADIENLIGFFVNTLVMRTNLSGEPSFRELVDRVREVALGAYSHQDVPFEMLVDEFAPDRDMSYSPLFQVMLVLQNTPRPSIEITTDLTLSTVEIHDRIARYDLTISFVEMDGRISGSLEYNTDLFRFQTIERMAGNFQNLLSNLVADPDQSITTVQLIGDDELKKLLVDWVDTSQELGTDTVAHRIFEQQVSLTPDAIALYFNGNELTYSELNSRSNQLAHYLIKLGVEPESVIGICTERSIEMIVAIIGVLKAGCAYLPIDPAYPDERIEYMIKDSGASIILTQEHLQARIDELGERGKVLVLETGNLDIYHQSVNNLNLTVYPKNLAYVIYTSGSTGRPKGTLLHHEGLVNFIIGQIKEFQIGSGSKMLQFASFSFDASVAEIFMALLSGATLYLASRDTLLSAPDLLELLRKNRITNAILPPSILNILPAEGLKDLSVLISAGEACTKDIIAHWAAGRRFFNGYGPTEATIGPTFYEVNDHEEEGLNIPIGQPIDNITVYILDGYQQPSPIGVTGEIYIGGIGLARGYHGRPEMTAERFVPDLFNIQSGTRLYRTGDLARYRDDGNLEFIGRVDHQVKVRGFRVELGEIENVLIANKIVREAVVIIQDKDEGQKQLIAYVVPENRDDLSLSGLRSYLHDNLPEYMIPGLFVVLDELPLTPNGKIDRRALPSLVTMEIDREREYIAPQTEEEQILADIWRQLLGVEQISIQDNFFDLGGDSIMVIQMISRANQAGIQITPRQLFQSPTILDLIAVAGEDRAEITAEQGLVTGEVPLTPIQHWFFEQQPINPAHWNTSMFLELFTDLDVDLLRQTIKHLLWHHDALRMRFSIHEGKWQQKGTIILDEGAVSIINLSDVTARKRKQAIESAAAEMQSSLNLSNGPLIRVAYFDLGEGVNNRLLLIIHHLAFDGVSWRILIEDFQTIYQQLMIGSQVSLQPKSTSYKYWSERLAEYDHSQTIRNEYSQWIQLVGEENEALTMDNPGGENIFGSMQNETMALSTKDTELLVHRAPKVFQSSINDILLTAMVRAFVPRTGKRKLLVELAGHGRGHYFNDVDVSRTIGWFSNNYPVLLNLEGVTELEQEISAIRDQMSRIPNDGIGFGLLRYLSIDDDIQSKMMSLPEPMVYFNYLGQFDQMPSGEWVPFRIADESPGPEQDARSIRSSLLHGVGIISGGELQIRWVYSKNLFKRGTIGKFAADYMKELRKIAKVISHNNP